MMPDFVFVGRQVSDDWRRGMPLLLLPGVPLLGVVLVRRGEGLAASSSSSSSLLSSNSFREFEGRAFVGEVRAAA